jgi:hypothetical protein
MDSLTEMIEHRGSRESANDNPQQNSAKFRAFALRMRCRARRGRVTLVMYKSKPCE